MRALQTITSISNPTHKLKTVKSTYKGKFVRHNPIIQHRHKWREVLFRASMLCTCYNHHILWHNIAQRYAIKNFTFIIQEFIILYILLIMCHDNTFTCVNLLKIACTFVTNPQLLHIYTMQCDVTTSCSYTTCHNGGMCESTTQRSLALPWHLMSNANFILSQEF